MYTIANIFEDVQPKNGRKNRDKGTRKTRTNVAIGWRFSSRRPALLLLSCFFLQLLLLFAFYVTRSIKCNILVFFFFLEIFWKVTLFDSLAIEPKKLSDWTYIKKRFTTATILSDFVLISFLKIGHIFL